MADRLDGVEDELTDALDELPTSVDSARGTVESASAVAQSSLEEVGRLASEGLDALRTADADLSTKASEGQEQLEAIKSEVEAAEERSRPAVHGGQVVD